MARPESDDRAVDLEAQTMEELERTPFAGTPVSREDLAALQKLQGPHAAPRCSTGQRELLQQCFPPES